MKPHENTSSSSWEREVDIVVIGAGAAGMAAALVASIEGLNVLLCEASDQVGGTAATSAGTIWVPGNIQSIAAGYSDSIDKAREYMKELIPNRDRDELRETYLNRAPEVVEYLRHHSVVEFIPCGKHPDYQDKNGAADTGRALAPRVFDGRLLGANFDRVRAPIPEFMVFGGLMVDKDDIPRLIGRFRSVRNFIGSSGLFLRYVTDRIKGYKRGTRLTMGNALVARLYASLLKQGTPILFDASITTLVRDETRVCGVELQMPNQILRVRALKGVVLATGGIAHNTELRRKYLAQPTPLHSLACPTNRGDGIRLGETVGGLVGDAPESSGGFWTPVSVTPMKGKPWGGLFPHLSMDRAKPGLIAVNSAGKRFVNEAVSYHDFVLAMFESHRSVPTIPAYLICEQKFVQKYGLGLIYPGTRNLDAFEKKGYIKRASSLKELATKINVNEDGFVSTVEHYNLHARQGADPEFQKGESLLNRFNGDANVKPNPCIAPIATGPFCAMAVWPAEIASSTGLLTDDNANVLTQSGEPILGLYACGNDIASIMDGTYPGPGTTLGPALTFAYLAVQHMKEGSSHSDRIMNQANTEKEKTHEK